MNIYADHNDITAIVGNLTWQNTISELATTMSFEVPKVDTYIPKLGSIICLVTNEEIFRGIVLTVDDGSMTVNKYTVCDFGFYLNKSKETYQFNGMSVNKLLTKICDDFKIDIDSITSINYTITKIFMDKTISEIIKDVLDDASQYTGYSYNFDVTPKGLRVYRFGDLKAYPEFRLSPNTALIYSPDLKGNVSHSLSIEDMKNSVKVITGNDDGFKLITTAKNDELISKYGLLQEIEKIDDDKVNSANRVANARLKELAVKKETFSFEIIEAVDSYTRAGYELTIDAGTFIIEGSSHSITNGAHKVKLDLLKIL